MATLSPDVAAADYSMSASGRRLAIGSRTRVQLLSARLDGASLRRHLEQQLAPPATAAAATPRVVLVLDGEDGATSAGVGDGDDESTASSGNDSGDGDEDAQVRREARRQRNLLRETEIVDDIFKPRARPNFAAEEREHMPVFGVAKARGGAGVAPLPSARRLLAAAAPASATGAAPTSPQPRSPAKSPTSVHVAAVAAHHAYKGRAAPAARIKAVAAVRGPILGAARPAPEADETEATVSAAPPASMVLPTSRTHLDKKRWRRAHGAGEEADSVAPAIRRVLAVSPSARNASAAGFATDAGAATVLPRQTSRLALRLPSVRAGTINPMASARALEVPTAVAMPSAELIRAQRANAAAAALRLPSVRAGTINPLASMRALEASAAMPSAEPTRAQRVSAATAAQRASARALSTRLLARAASSNELGLSAMHADRAPAAQIALTAALDNSPRAEPGAFAPVPYRDNV